MVIANKLHLESLHIEGFRGIDSLSLPRLGQVTLLAGKNGVGKTTVLEAIEVYTAANPLPALNRVLFEREDGRLVADQNGSVAAEPMWPAILHGRNMAPGKVEIGPIGNTNRQFTVEPVLLTDEQATSLVRDFREITSESVPVALRFTFNGQQLLAVPLFLKSKSGVEDAIEKLRNSLIWQDGAFVLGNPSTGWTTPCFRMGSRVASAQELALLWDRVALTPQEDLAIHALNLALVDVKVRGVAAVGGEVGSGEISRRIMVRADGFDSPVPLRSLGDGAVRLFGVAAALANAKGGFALIDEVENGIHHSLQVDYWRMVLETAALLNIQVVATTHSWDCVRGFARALAAVEDADGLLYRLSRAPAGLAAIDYTSDDLRVAADQQIEVR